MHLRRPSRLSTLQLPDTQPFVDPAGRFAFSHNGELARWQGARAAYRDQGRIEGRADSEVGQRWLEDAWSEDVPAAALLQRLHDGFGGLANLAILGRDGSCHHYAGNPENPVFTFRLGRIGVASTAIYSIDRSLFRYAAPGATRRRLARPTTTDRARRARRARAGGSRGRPDRLTGQLRGTEADVSDTAILVTACPTDPTTPPTAPARPRCCRSRSSSGSRSTGSG